jgi:type III pantothenate kinase
VNLTIDLGNTLAKMAMFEGKNLSDFFSTEKLSLHQLSSYCEKRPRIRSAILSSVIDQPKEITDYLSKNYFFIELGHKTPLPFRNLYQTAETLGNDRLATAAGAMRLFPGQDVLSIDAGTCIKYDFVNKKNEYVGGGISPGIEMRFRALNTFTGKLPLLHMQPFEKLVGETTEESILSGVLNGVAEEMNGIIGKYSEKFSGLKVLITGGSYKFFVSRMKSPIFEEPFLLMKGLNYILEYNAGK